MSTDLVYLAYTAVLTASLWIPYVVCQAMTNGPLKPQNYKDPTPRPLPLWGKRADRVYMNAIEVFAPFAALIMIAHLAGKPNSVTGFCAMFFFWMRVAHAVAYWFAIPYVRTLAFTAGWIAVIGLFWQVIF